MLNDLPKDIEIFDELNISCLDPVLKDYVFSSFFFARLLNKTMKEKEELKAENTKLKAQLEECAELKKKFEELKSYIDKMGELPDTKDVFVDFDKHSSNIHENAGGNGFMERTRNGLSEMEKCEPDVSSFVAMESVAVEPELNLESVAEAAPEPEPISEPVVEAVPEPEPVPEPVKKEPEVHVQPAPVEVAVEKTEPVPVKVESQKPVRIEPLPIPPVKRDLNKLSVEQLTPEYIQNLIDRISAMEEDPDMVNEEEIKLLNAELDAILQALM